jgi:quinoprotein glucose dehydrogenase
VCRGVAYWRVPNHRTDLCAARIFLATNDRRLIALDAGTGKPCAGFGDKGTVAIVPVAQMFRPGEVQITSAPVATHGLVLVGSSIDDNQRVDAPRGTVNAYDAVTGALLWTFDPLPRAAIISSSNTGMTSATSPTTLTKVLAGPEFPPVVTEGLRKAGRTWHRP